MKKTIKLQSCAKINLGLSVLSKRDDGYHNVDMIMQSLNLCDFITLEKNDVLKTGVFCDKELNCKSENNTAYKAAAEFFKYTGVNDFFININIKKNIPVCAGLAGGSGNAAAVLLGLNSMMETNLNINQLAEIGKGVGADVPFFIFGGTARATGIGTNLEKIKSRPKYYVLIVKPGISISTKNAYAKIDLHSAVDDAFEKCLISYNSLLPGGGEKPRGQFNFFQSNSYIYENTKIDNILIGINKNDTKIIAANLFNDLENCLSDKEKKEIDYIKEFMVSMKALNACMSGSGPSVYGIFDEESTAKKCLEKIKTEYSESFFCRPVDYGVKILSPF
ncbi:MAG: 4-(cytidine 5'-diphospho)-2-C-methyl-D-erythritol kinase [Oscillospiraceae bacterium]|jgi:4-diphosphocytidyl-2-C-methyl-D-erythritol kinase|nr:4-(cytidine 5'-diphospho)-2-C-methyl-D-erythritol kinase [Oscillospiraceae bacterium]